MSSTVSSAALPAPSPRSLPPRSLTTTLAPCWASSIAWPRPMPWPAPVTIATLPSSSPTAPPVCRSCVSDGRQDAGLYIPPRERAPRPDPCPRPCPVSVHRAAALWPDDEALVDRDTRLTFAPARRRGARGGAGVRRHRAATGRPGVDLGAEHRTSGSSPRSALYAAGGVLVPLNTRFKGTEAAHVLRTSGARFLFTVTDFLDTDYVALLDERRRARPASRRSWSSRAGAAPGTVELGRLPGARRRRRRRPRSTRARRRSPATTTVRHPLHVGHDRRAQGRDAAPRRERARLRRVGRRRRPARTATAT